MLTSLKLFEIKNTVVGLFRNGFIEHLDYQSVVGLEQKSKTEESAAETTKLRKQKLNEIFKNKKETNLELFKKYFKYSSPVDMYKYLKRQQTQKEIQTESIKNTLTNLRKDAENAPKDNANKIKENNKIIDIVEHILCLNEENQQGSNLNTRSNA